MKEKKERDRVKRRTERKIREKHWHGARQFWGEEGREIILFL